MNETFVEIMIDHDKALTDCSRVFMENMTRAKKINEGNEDTSYKVNTYERVSPGNYGYTERLSDDTEKVHRVLAKMANKCMTDCKDSIKKPPVGMEVPTTDVKSDDEIKGYYKELRTVIHDKLQEAAEQGGQGWVKFIDTLATPEERASNYRVPTNFDNVFTSFLKEKKVLKTTRDDVAKAVKVICDYDKEMEGIIESANEYVEEYKKDIWILNSKAIANEFAESAEYMAEAMAIIEEDFINALCLEARKDALIEQVKNAHKILYGLVTYDPHHLKESAITHSVQFMNIDEAIDSVNENPDQHIKTVTEGEKVINNRFSTVVKMWNESNSKFMDKFTACNIHLEQTNGIGLSSMKKFYEPKNYALIIESAIEAVNNKLNHKELSKLDQDELNRIKEDAVNFFRSIETDSINESLTLNSPVFGTVRTTLAGNDILFGKFNNHILTKNDVKKAIKSIKEVSDDIYHIKEAYQDARKRLVYEEQLDFDKVSSKTRTLNEIEKTRRDINKRLLEMKIEGLCEQLTIDQSQSRIILAKAARGLIHFENIFFNEITDNIKALKSILE